MIFVTIGTQEPFDRLIRTMDSFASTIPHIPVVAQISKSEYLVKHMRALEFISPLEFGKLFKQADLVVSHAGMGTIISALQSHKPIIVLPRKASLKEHRNDHQLATAKKMLALNYVYVAFSEEELLHKLADLLDSPRIEPLHKLSDIKSTSLTESIKSFIE